MRGEGLFASADFLNLPKQGLHGILPRELGRKVGKLKQKTVEVLQLKINTNTNFNHMNKSYQISASFINLVVENKEGGDGGLKERSGL